MVAATIRTIFAQPAAAEVTAQLDKVATMLGRQFPAIEDMLRDAGAVLIETHDEWAVAERRYLSEGSMAKIYETDNDVGTTKEVEQKTKELLPC